VVLESLSKELEFFENNFGEIVRDHGRDSYVAIYGRGVVDFDKSEFKLNNRISRDYMDDGHVLIIKPKDYSMWN
jgi:hypothetical protein